MSSVNKGLVYWILGSLSEGYSSDPLWAGVSAVLLPDAIIVLDAVLALLGPDPLFCPDVGRTYTLYFTEQTFVRNHGRIWWLIVISLPHDDRVSNTWEIQIGVAIANQWVGWRLLLWGCVRLGWTQHFIYWLRRPGISSAYLHICMYCMEICWRNQRTLCILLRHSMIKTTASSRTIRGDSSNVAAQTRRWTMRTCIYITA